MSTSDINPRRRKAQKRLKSEALGLGIVSEVGRDSGVFTQSPPVVLNMNKKGSRVPLGGLTGKQVVTLVADQP